MEDMHDVFSELTQICKDHGYTTKNDTREGEGDYSRWDFAALCNDFSLEQMLEGYYLEAILNIMNNNLLVMYDILEGSYECIVFIEDITNKIIEEEFKEKLIKEVERLGLEKYKFEEWDQKDFYMD